MMNTSPVIPDLKFQKVGKERKRGGAAWMPRSGAEAGFSAAMGGSGSGGGFVAAMQTALGPKAALLVPKLLAAAIFSSFAGSAWILGKAATAAQQAGSTKKASKAFEMPLPKVREANKNADTGGDSSGMVSGSRDGLTSEQRVAAEAAAKAEADAKAQAAAPVEKTAEAPAGVPDISKLMAGAGAGPKAGDAGSAGPGGKAGGINKNPFGNISSSIGGGGAGGGHNFSATPMAKQGESSHVGAKGLSGNLVALAAPGATSRSSSALGRATGGGRGLGFNQLAKAAQLSGTARTSSVNETASQNAANAFEPGAGITGGGAVIGGPGDTEASGGSNSHGGGAGGGGGTQSSGGGPHISQPASVPGFDDCGTIFPSGNMVNSAAGGCSCPPGQDSAGGGTCTDVRGNKNTAKYQPLVQAIGALLALAGVLMTVAFIYSLLAKQAETTLVGFGLGAGLQSLAFWFATSGAILSGIAALLSFAIVGMGGSGQSVGGQLFLLSGIMTAACIVSAVGVYNPGAHTIGTVATVAAGVGAVGGLFGGTAAIGSTNP